MFAHIWVVIKLKYVFDHIFDKHLKNKSCLISNLNYIIGKNFNLK